MRGCMDNKWDGRVLGNMTEVVLWGDEYSVFCGGADLGGVVGG